MEFSKDGNTDPSLYEIAYTFNEAVQPLATDNLAITGATIRAVENVSSTQTVYSITITTTGDFVTFNLQNIKDLAGNVTATTAVETEKIGVLTLLKTTYVDADINQQGDIYNIFLQFSEAISADILSNEDITNSGNIKDHTIDIDNTNNANATFYFELVNGNNTEKIDFTIDNLQTVDETDEYPLNFSIDFSPRVISIAGDLAATYNIATLAAKNNSLSVTLEFSEAVTGLTIGDIFTDTVEGITPTLQFTDNTKEATLDIKIATETEATFTFPRIADGKYQDGEGNTNIENETYDYSQQYRIDSERPYIPVFTDEDKFLPITDKANFNFTLVFSENINIDTFTATDILLTPSGLVSITDDGINFNGSKNRATITVTTLEALSTAAENLIISVGTDYKDEAGNTPSEQRKLYDLDVVKPTVSKVQFNEVGSDNTRDYRITYNFSEPVKPLTASNLNITGAETTSVSNVTPTQTIFSITATANPISYYLQNIEDLVGNRVMATDTQTERIGELSLIDQTYFGDEIRQEEAIYNITLQFSEAINDLTSDDITTDSSNIKDHTIDIDTNNTDATFYFELVNVDNTEKIDFTIDNLQTADETDEAPLTFSVDFAPRVISIDGDDCRNL